MVLAAKWNYLNQRSKLQMWFLWLHSFLCASHSSVRQMQISDQWESEHQKWEKYFFHLNINVRGSTAMILDILDIFSHVISITVKLNILLLELKKITWEVTEVMELDQEHIAGYESTLAVHCAPSQTNVPLLTTRSKLTKVNQLLLSIFSL